MHLKQRKYSSGVLFAYITILAIITSRGHSEPTVTISPHEIGEHSQLNPYPIGAELHEDGRDPGIQTTQVTINQTNRSDRFNLRGKRPQRRRYHHDRNDGEEVGKASSFQNQDGPIPRNFKPNMESFSDLKDTDWDGSSSLSNKECREGRIHNWIEGNFYISGHLETSIPDFGYQSDSAISIGKGQGGQVLIRGLVVNDSEENGWLKLAPMVECGEKTMTLTVKKKLAAQLLLNRVNDSAQPLTQLPNECGYSVMTTWRDLMLVVSHDACHVTVEDGNYVLPLLWRGTAVRMSCPVTHSKSMTLSSLCCTPHGMTIPLQGDLATEKLRVKVRGKWIPLTSLAQQCGYTLDRKDGELLITAPFIACGITIKDGNYTLGLQVGEQEVKLTCPVSHSADDPQTYLPPVNAAHLPTTAPETLSVLSRVPVLPWTPPFYLAPPYFPHPTLHPMLHPTHPKGKTSHEIHDRDYPASTLPLAQIPAVYPEPLPVDFSPETKEPYQYYFPSQMSPRNSYEAVNVLGSRSPTVDESEYSAGADAGLEQRAHVPGHSQSQDSAQTSSSVKELSVVAPSVQPPNNAFSQYYHYYHHPKIPVPLPEAPQIHDPGVETTTSQSSSEDEQPAPVMQNYFNYWIPGRVDSPSYFEPVAQVVPPPSPPPIPVINPLPHSGVPKPAVLDPQQPYTHSDLYHRPYLSRDMVEEIPHSHDVTVNTAHQPADPQSPEKFTSDHLPPDLPQPPLHYTNFHLDEPNHHSSSESHDESETENHPHGTPFRSLPDYPGHASHVYGHLRWVPHQQLSEDEKMQHEQKDKRRPSTPDALPIHSHPPPNFPYLDFPQHQLVNGYNQKPRPIAVPPPEQLSISNPVPPHLQSHLVYNHPYYYYHISTGPTSSVNPINHLAPSNDGSDPLLQTAVSTTLKSHHPAHLIVNLPQLDSPSAEPPHPAPLPLHNMPQNPTPKAQSNYDFHSAPLHPYYHHYFHPKDELEIPRRYQEVKPITYTPSAEMASKLESQPPSYPGHSREESQPGYKAFFSPLSQHVPVHLPGIPTLPDGEREEHKLFTSMRGCTVGRHFVFSVPDSVSEPMVAPPDPNRDVYCTPQKLTSHPKLYTVPLDGCGVHRYMSGQTMVYKLELQGLQSLKQNQGSIEDFPVRLMVECRSSPGSPGKVTFQVMNPSPAPPVQSPPATVTVQLRIATDKSFSSFYPEVSRPLSRLQGSPVYLEVVLLSPPEPGMVLLVHYCLAYTLTPYISWMRVYDGCPNHGHSQPHPPPQTVPHSKLSHRLKITSFLSKPPLRPSHLEDPKVYFMCSTEVCATADANCTVGCISRPRAKAVTRSEDPRLFFQAYE